MNNFDYSNLYAEKLIKEEINPYDDSFDSIYKVAKNSNNNNISELVTSEITNKHNGVEIQHLTNFSISPIYNKKKSLLGRKTKSSNLECKRNKFSKDNRIHKFKTLFYQKFLINLVNFLIYTHGYENKYKIRKVNSKFVKDLTINLNLKVLNSTLAEYFSLKISEKYSKQNKNSNKNIIEELKKKNEFKELLNTKINDLYEIFINDECENIIQNKYNIKVLNKIGLKYLLNQEKDEKYKLALEESCKNIYKFFNIDNARKK